MQNEIRIAFFGPGYGECIVVQVGGDEWVIIDSCLDDAGTPVALSYLASVGVDPSTKVKAVVATHWHDDHIKGLSEVLSACKSARFYMSAALTEREFLAYLIAHEDQPSTNLDRGGSEIIKCINLLSKRQTCVCPVVCERIIYSEDPDKLAHGCPVEMIALSPSDAKFRDFLLGFRESPSFSNLLQRLKKEPKARLAPDRKNDLSIAVLLTIGSFSILFGSDVEENGDPSCGWQNIVLMRDGKVPRPFLFKVAHHGSEGAHYEPLWTKILRDAPVSVVTPWRLGGHKLPSDDRIAKIKHSSSRSFLTSSVGVPIKKRYDRDTNKLVDHAGVTLLPNVLHCGSVVITIETNAGNIIDVSLSNGAIEL